MSTPNPQGVQGVQGTERPHVLVLMADQYRWDCLSIAGEAGLLPQGASLPKTPNLDRLAHDGVWFPKAFCPLPVCTPSRYSLLSGLYVHQHGGWTNRCTLTPEIETFPKALRRAGYGTHAVGKMHLTPTYLDVGFDTMELAEQNGPGRYEDDYHRELMAAGLVPSSDLIDQEREWREGAPAAYRETFGAERSNLPEEWHSTTWIGDRAVRAIDRWTETFSQQEQRGQQEQERPPGRPQLLMASFVKPHHPFDPPAPWDALYDPDALTPLPGWTDEAPADDLTYNAGYFPHESLTEAALRRVMAHYYATITQLDHQIGRMLAALDRQGLYERTMIVFTADHGEYLGYHHLLLKGGQMYEPLIRVPLIVKPARATAGPSQVSDVMASTIDVAPTILRGVGLDVPAGMRGLTLMSAGAARDYVFAENRRGAAYMARSDRWKLLIDRDAARTRFYDLVQDPHELRNLATDPAHAEVMRQHRDALADWMLFESPTPVRLDDAAPVVTGTGSHQPDQAREQREALLAFFRQEMARRES